MKNNKHKITSVRMKRQKDGYFHFHKVKIEDYEKIKYPNLDVKRAVIDKVLADKINDLYLIIDEILEK
jgi:hypothetical protein